jgi:DNA mismatch repair protein MutL
VFDAARVADGVDPFPAARVRGGGGQPKSGPPDTPLGRLIGQYRGSFLLLEDDHGLVIVDQHVAHERVLYERVRRRLAEGRPAGQRLLEPILLEVGEPLAAALPRVADLLTAVGLEVVRFGPTTVRVEAIPVELEGEAAQELISELLERATSLDLDPAGALDALAHEVAAGLSCRGAIKVNHALTVEEQRALVSDLMATKRPYRCPHGRPIVLRLSQEEMERRLGRR